MHDMNGMQAETMADLPLPAITTAADRIAALKKQIEEETETAILELHAEAATLEKRLAEVRAQVAAICGEPAKAKRGGKRRAKKAKAAGDAPDLPKIDDGRPLSQQIHDTLVHSQKDALRSEEIAAAIGEDSKVVSAELRKMRDAGQVHVVRGEKRASEWGLVAS